MVSGAIKGAGCCGMSVGRGGGVGMGDGVGTGGAVNFLIGGARFFRDSLAFQHLYKKKRKCFSLNVALQKQKKSQSCT